MIFSWLKRRRRRRILARPFPEQWDRWITANVYHDRRLTPLQRARLRRLVHVFVTEKHWEGCGGLDLTDEIKVTIAAQACLLVVGMSEDLHFDHVLSVLVYPAAYVAPETHVGRSITVVDEGGQARLGEAWWRGPVVLSWSDARDSGQMRSPGQNVVLHEFAHQLDMMNGRTVDGTPLLHTEQQLERWINVLGPAFEQLVDECKHHRHGFIDCYGATNSGEFFAVLTETYFELPHRLLHHHPEIYDVLRDFFGLDPALWEGVDDDLHTGRH